MQHYQGLAIKQINCKSLRTHWDSPVYIFGFRSKDVFSAWREFCFTLMDKQNQARCHFGNEWQPMQHILLRLVDVLDPWSFDLLSSLPTNFIRDVHITEYRGRLVARWKERHQFIDPCYRYSYLANAGLLLWHAYLRNYVTELQTAESLFQTIHLN